MGIIFKGNEYNICYIDDGKYYIYFLTFCYEYSCDREY